MSRIVRNLATDESRDFWSKAEKAAAEVEAWPAWKRAGINVAELRTEAREVPEFPTATTDKKNQSGSSL